MVSLQESRAEVQSLQEDLESLRHVNSMLKQKDIRQLRIKDIAQDLRAIEKDSLSLKKKDDWSTPEEKFDAISQFPDPECGEMLTRWDMIEAPLSDTCGTHTVTNTIRIGA